jgi:hypothetical protein
MTISSGASCTSSAFSESAVIKRKEAAIQKLITQAPAKKRFFHILPLIPRSIATPVPVYWSHLFQVITLLSIAILKAKINVL